MCVRCARDVCAMCTQCAHVWVEAGGPEQGRERGGTSNQNRSYIYNRRLKHTVWPNTVDRVSIRDRLLDLLLLLGTKGVLYEIACAEQVWF